MKTILITGASSGIGRAVALKMAASGWHVGLLARRTDALQTVADEIGSPCTILLCDVASESAVDAAFSRYINEVGRLDCLFNNAGIFTPSAAIDALPVADWQRVLDVNLTGMFLCARAAFRQMRAQSPQGGRIINNGSVSAHVPREGAVAYTVTKHGVTGLTRQLALDGRALDIACGQIDIGNAETDILRAIAKSATDRGETPPPMIDTAIVADAVHAMAELPLSANTLFQTLMATKMPFVGRG